VPSRGATGRGLCGGQRLPGGHQGSRGSALGTAGDDVGCASRKTLEFGGLPLFLYVAASDEISVLMNIDVLHQMHEIILDASVDLTCTCFLF
jgi:hypothetical protein